MKVSHKIQSFEPLFSETEGKQNLHGLEYVHYPNANTLAKNWIDTWDFANFIKSGWGELKNMISLRLMVSFTLIHFELLQVILPFLLLLFTLDTGVPEQEQEIIKDFYGPNSKTNLWNWHWD